MSGGLVLLGLVSSSSSFLDPPLLGSGVGHLCDRSGFQAACLGQNDDFALPAEEES